MTPNDYDDIDPDDWFDEDVDDGDDFDDIEDDPEYCQDVKPCPRCELMDIGICEDLCRFCREDKWYDEH